MGFFLGFFVFYSCLRGIFYFFLYVLVEGEIYFVEGFFMEIFSFSFRGVFYFKVDFVFIVFNSFGIF